MTRDLTLDAPVQDAASIRHAAGLCLKRVDLSQRLRLLGVRVGKLSRPGDIEPVRRTRNAASKSDPASVMPKPENLQLFS